jgi:predicted GNAT superfamily acetyltransferase
MPAAPAFAIRPLVTHAELRACVELQRATWGREFSDVVPPSILKVSQRIGGVAAGAFDEGGTLLGFVFGMAGVERGRVVHWSDMLAVRAEARDLGVGRRLKAWQRDAARAAGAEVMYWTYDPLVARNAHLNLATLGARAAEYVVDMYGDGDSDLHRGLGTDRFVVAWDLVGPPEGDAPRDRPVAPPAGADAPVVNPTPDDALVVEGLDASAVRVRIPLDIHAVRAGSPETAAAWRASTRRAFLHYLGRGYRVAGFVRDEGAGSYVLTRGG